MNLNFFIDIGITVILRVLSTAHIPKGYVKGLVKLRDALNLAFPDPTPASGKVADHITVA